MENHKRNSETSDATDANESEETTGMFENPADDGNETPDVVVEIGATEALNVDSLFIPGTIVMVKRKLIHWPGKVISGNSQLIEIMVFDKARTKESKHPKFPF